MKNNIVKYFFLVAMLGMWVSHVNAAKVIASGSEFDFGSPHETQLRKMGYYGYHGSLFFTLSDNPGLVILDSGHPFAGTAIVMAKAFNYDVDVVSMGCYGGTYTCINNMAIVNINGINQPNRVTQLLFLNGQSYAGVPYPFATAGIGGGAEAVLLLTTGQTMLASLALMQNKTISYTKTTVYVYNQAANTMLQIQNVADNISFQ